MSLVVVISIALKRNKAIVVASVPCANKGCHGRRYLTFDCLVKSGLPLFPESPTAVCDECGISFGTTRDMRQEIFDRILAEIRAKQWQKKWQKRKVASGPTPTQLAT